MKQWKRLLAMIALCIGLMMSGSHFVAADGWTNTIVDPDQEKEQALLVEEKNGEIVEQELTSVASEGVEREPVDLSREEEEDREGMERPVLSTSDDSGEEATLPTSCDTYSMTIVESDGIPYDRDFVEVTFVGTAVDGSSVTYALSLPNEGDGTYRWSKSSLPVGTYEVKVDGRSLWARSIVLTYLGNCSTVAQLRPVEDGFGNEADPTDEGDHPSVVENGEDVVVNDSPPGIVDRPNEGGSDGSESIVSHPDDDSVVERPTVQEPVVVSPAPKVKQAAHSSSLELEELPQTGEGTCSFFIIFGSFILLIGFIFSLKRSPRHL